MIVVDAWTAEKLILTLVGRSLDDGPVKPAIALSEPLVERLFTTLGNGQLTFDDEQAVRRCRCGHLGPQYQADSSCGDCLVERAEAAFRQRWRQFTLSCRRNVYLQEMLRRFEGVVHDPLRQFWRLGWSRVYWQQIWDDPYQFARTGRRHSDEMDVGESATRYFSSTPRRIDRRSETIDSLHYRLGPHTPWVRICVSTTVGNLIGLPLHVALAIERVRAEFDRQVVAGVRAANARIRRVCKPLGTFRVFSRGGATLLDYGGRRYELFRAVKDLPTRRVWQGCGRPPGCRLTVLPETEAALNREIAYFHKKGRIRPSARRFTQPNPMEEAPEDWWSIAQCFFMRAKRVPDDTKAVRTKRAKKRPKKRRPKAKKRIAPPDLWGPNKGDVVAVEKSGQRAAESLPPPAAGPEAA